MRISFKIELCFESFFAPYVGQNFLHSDSYKLIGSLKILRLYTRFQIFVLKIPLSSQGGCNLKSAEM